MEDIHFSGALAEHFTSAMDGIGDDFLPTEAMSSGVDELSKTEDDVAPVLHMPTHTVEVVINQKAPAKAEEPILPDHYYNDGNIPVFKPVC